MNNNRIIGLDIAKSLAAMFVVVLHVNGFTMFAHGIQSSSISSTIAYYGLEGISFLAVNLFVLSGSYLLCKNYSVKLKSVFRIWLTTLIITVLGLCISLGIGLKPAAMSILQSLFPISLRAYGYVSSYLVLMLLSPFFNIIIEKLSLIQLLYFTGILVIINIVFPSVIPFIGWGENYTILFVCLYFVASLIRKINETNSIQNTKKLIYLGGSLWLFMTIALIVSPFIIKALAANISYFNGKELFFYNYQNFVVFSQAIGLFLVLANFPLNNFFIHNNNRFAQIVTLFSKSSLVIYIYHMHPVFKRFYHNLEIFGFLYSNNGYFYFIKVLSFSAFVYAIGVIIASGIISKIVDYVLPLLLNMIKKRPVFVKFLVQCKISCE